MRDLDRDVARILEPFNTTDEDGNSQSTFNPTEQPATACALLVDHLSMRRNKRCLLAYHRVRIEKLETMAWEGRDLHDTNTNAAQSDGAQQPTTTSKDNSGSGPAAGSATQNSLSPEEESFFHQYTDLLSQFKGQWTDIDLTGALVPPRDLFIDVRVLKDAGEIQTEYGAINLTKNSQFYVRQGDVEKLIQMGFLQRLS